MGYFKLFLLLWLAFTILIQLMSISIRVTYLRDGSDDELILILSSFFGLINIKWETNLIQLMVSKTPGIRMKHEIEMTGKGKPARESGQFSDYKEIWEQMERLLKLYDKYRKAMFFLKARITIRELSWKTTLGTGDAAVTGIAIGLLWNLKTIFLYFVNNQAGKLAVDSIEIVPSFNEARFRTHFDCILRFKIGHAIIAGIIAVTALLKDGDNIE